MTPSIDRTLHQFLTFTDLDLITEFDLTDRPKSVRNSCVIKVFGGVFMLSRCFLDCSVGVGVFVTGLSQISSFFYFYLIVQGFHRTYATGAACQQRTLTPPDTWSSPTLGLACVLMSRPISPELVLSPDL